MQTTFLTALVCSAGLLLSGCGNAVVAMAPAATPETRTQAVAERGMTEGLNYATVDLLGVSAKEAAYLSTEGVHSAGDMLRAGAKAESRRRLSAKAGITTARILKWVNYADLMRMTGVGPRYSFLLEESGVDTVAELAQRNPASLYAAVKVANLRSLVSKMPSPTQVGTWVKKAQTMPRVVEY